MAINSKRFLRATSPPTAWKKYGPLPRVCLGTVFLCLVLWASQPWKAGDPASWSGRDIDMVLNESPWAQTAGAVFGLAGDDSPPPPAIDIPQAGMPNPRNSATDGRWDGGVGRVNRNGPPTLNVTVRWDSALPVRQAFERQHTAPLYTEERIRQDYVIAVLGLVPAGHYGRPELNTRSGDGAVDVRNPEELLEGVMRYSRLYPRGKASLRPEDAKLDSATGTLHLFFRRSDTIALSDKEVTFETRFGSLSIVKKFRLKDMLYRGQLEL